MIQCKIPKTDDDLKNKINFRWDSIVNDKKLDVYCLQGYYHTIGGRHGLNDLYCCNRGEKLTIKNIIAFNGESCKWDMNFISNNYNKNKYNDESIEHNYKLIILRNNKPFYTLCSYNMDYLLAKYKTIMIEIEEHPISFHLQDYQSEIVGRKILWKNIPCIIYSYGENYDLSIIPDGTEEEKKLFKKYAHDFEDDYIVEDLFSPSINWFR